MDAEILLRKAGERDRAKHGGGSRRRLDLAGKGPWAIPKAIAAAAPSTAFADVDRSPPPPLRGGRISSGLTDVG